MDRVIDQVCDEFELAWQRGEPLSIEAVLDESATENREQLLEELIRLEISLRQAAGERPSVAEYSERFPERLAVIQTAIPMTMSVEETVDLKTGQQDITIDLSGGSESSSKAPDGVPLPDRQTIGRYTVIGKLGSGGQADVFRAVHPTLPIEVAIKLTHTALTDTAREALREEAHILCDLDHPHIARIRDFDFDNGRPFMVLDFIRGRSLGQVAAAEPYTAEAAAAIVAKVARAIGFANARGIIHRDLKPDNIVIDSSGEPKIIDFGMSRLRSGFNGEAEEANGVSGTLAYMSPEQAEGITAKTDHRVDVFALGAILYRLLVGKAPYQSMDVTSLLGVVRQGSWDTASLDESPAPDALKAICRQAMSHIPGERFATAESMALGLEEWIASHSNQVITPAGVAPASSPHPTSGSRPWAISASGLGCAVSLTIGMSMLFLMPGYLFFQSRDDDRRDRISINSYVPTAPVTRSDGPSSNDDIGLIHRFEIVHIGNSDDRAEFSGELLQYRVPRENDDIQIRANFREPVYCFLVALNPDGVKQLCYPSDASVAQSAPITTLRYPSDEDSAFGLTDGIGQQAFVLYTSRKPLPAYDAWDSELTQASWPNPDVSGNWVYLEGQLEAIKPTGSSTGNETRGVVRETKTPTPFKQMCDRLRATGSVEIGGVLFEVQPDHSQ